MSKQETTVLSFEMEKLCARETSLVLLAGYESTQVSNHLAHLKRGFKVGRFKRGKGCDSLF